MIFFVVYIIPWVKNDVNLYSLAFDKKKWYIFKHGKSHRRQKRILFI